MAKSVKKVRKTKKSATEMAKPAKKRSAKSSRATKSRAKPAKDPKSDRRVKADRRTAEERRKKGEPVERERRTIQRRAVVNRRRQIDPTTCERDYSEEEIEFMNALDDYKRKSGRMFPTCSEVLEVVKDLGYVKRTSGEQAVAEPDATQADAVKSHVGEQGSTRPLPR